MNNELSPVVLWLELSQCCKNIITIVLGVKGAPLGGATIEGNSNGFHAMVTVIFRSRIVCLPISGGVSPVEARSAQDPSLGRDGLGRESLHRQKQAD
jgi:hypothetical protein